MMSANGLTKLIEECGELIQICAKKLAYYDTDDHPDGKGSMEARMIEEMGDVMAAISFVGRKFHLNVDAVLDRADKKINLFLEWDNSSDNIADGYDFSNKNLEKALSTIKFNAENLSHISKINGDLRKRIKELEDQVNEK